MSKTKISYHNRLVFSLILALFCCTPAFALTPEIHSVEPDRGVNDSPTDITIYGDNFESIPKVALYGGGPYIIGSADTPGAANGVYVMLNYAYVSVGSGLQVLRVFKPCTNITFVDSTTLTATVPAGLPPGSHNLQVTNPNPERDILYNAFTVTEGNRDGGGGGSSGCFIDTAAYGFRRAK